jgi:hypothetical protein
MNHLRLISIGARNLKGLSFDLDLKPATFLVGPNYVGKTARADAIRLLLVGHLPELGKTNAATFGLSSGKELEVHGVFEDAEGQGYPVSRRWFLKGDSVKAEEDFPPNFAAEGLVEVMLNAESWFGKTERERVEWVYANAAVSTEIPREQIVTDLLEKVLKDDPSYDPTVRDELFKSFLAIVAADEEEHGPFTTADFVNSALEAFERTAKQERDHAVRMDKTVSGLAGLRAADAPVADAREIEARIRKLDDELAKLRDDRGRASAAADAQRANARRVRALKDALAGKETLGARKGDAILRIGNLKDQLAALPAIAQGDIDELRKELLDESLTERSLARDLTELSREWTRVEGEKLEISGKTSCPYCGAAGEGWKALKLAEIEAAIAGLSAKREDLFYRHENSATAVATYNDRLVAKVRAFTERTELRERMRIAEDNLSKIELELAALSGKSEELAAIPADDPAVEQRPNEFLWEINTKQAELDKLDGERRAILGRSNDLKRLAEAEKGRDDARACERIAKAAAAALRDVKARMVGDAFGPILELANRFCGPLLPTLLEFDVARAEIGTRRGGLWVGHKTFSGVERLLAYAGIQAAFASRAPLRVMILDEMLRADADVFPKLVRACKDAVRNGLVDNFVGIIPAAAMTFMEFADEACQLVEIS